MTFFNPGSFSAGFIQPPGGSIGTLYNKSSWSDLSDFTVTGFTPGTSSNQITFSGGAGNFSQYMVFHESNLDEKLTVTTTYTLGAIDGNSYGMGVGRKSQHGGYTQDTTVHYDHRTNGSGDNLHIWSNSNLVAQMACNLSQQAGHQLRITFTQNREVITATVVNLSNGNSKTLQASSNLAPVKNLVISNVSKPCLWNFGGAMTINAISLSSAMNNRPRLVYIGDSKTVGYSAESINARFSSMSGYASAETYAGDGDRTEDIVAGLTYFTSRVKASKAILCIGRNDLANGIPSGTWQANYQSIVSALQGTGATVIHLLPIPEPVQDQSSLKSWVQSTYSAGLLVDPSVGWSDGTHISTDNVHPNAAGHQLVATALLNSGYL